MVLEKQLHWKLGKYFKDNNRSVVFGAQILLELQLLINYKFGQQKLKLILLNQK